MRNEPFCKKRRAVDTMQKPNKPVINETIYIAAVTVALSIITEAVFAALGHWYTAVLFGNLLGGGTAVINFFLMGITVQAASKKEGDGVAATVRISQLLRLLLLTAAAIIGCTVGVFNAAAVLISLFFPRIGVAFRPLFLKNSI